MHSSFLLKSHKDLHGKIKLIFNCLVSLLTAEWGGHLSLLGQSQNAMELLELLLKKALKSWDMVIECSWKKWVDESKIYLVARMASVITIICSVFKIWTAWLISHLIKNNSASVEWKWHSSYSELFWWTCFDYYICIRLR